MFTLDTPHWLIDANDFEFSGILLVSMILKSEDFVDLGTGCNNKQRAPIVFYPLLLHVAPA